MKMQTTRQQGASMTEFLVVAPVLLFLGLGTVQAGLLYHGKTTLNYATFEAARAGAVNNARVEPMRSELGFRLAPVEGGDGTAGKAMLAVGKSIIAVSTPYMTQIEILNPTEDAFAAWGVDSQESDHFVIPNSHLRHRSHDTRGSTPISLRDANLLKIKVTYGFELEVPLVGSFVAAAMTIADPEHALFYAAGKFPLTSVATVRMQSEAWKNEVVAANVAIEEAQTQSQVTTSIPTDATPVDDGVVSGTQPSQGCDGPFGIDASSGVISTVAAAEGSCSAADTGYSSPGVPGSGDAAGNAATLQAGDC